MTAASSSTIERTIPLRKMSSGEDFCFGKALMKPSTTISYNPDKLANNHILVCGRSRSGKSRLIREFIPYFARLRKRVDILDMHGDLGINTEQYGLPPENVIELSGRNSEYGINPFEFERDEKNGGPRNQVPSIIKMFKKTFMPDLGSKQRTALEKLIIDTYKLKGFDDNDSSTWRLDIKDKREWGLLLPTVKDMKELLVNIRDTLQTGFNIEFAKLIRKNGKLLNESHQMISSKQRTIDKLKEKRPDEVSNLQTQIYLLNEEISKLEKSEEGKDSPSGREIESLKQEKKDLDIRLNAILEQNTSHKALEEQITKLEEEIKQIKSKIWKERTKLEKYFSDYLGYTFLGEDIPEYTKIVTEQKYDFIDIKAYSAVSNVLADLDTYLTSLVDAGIFHNKIPSISSVINRYNLKGLSKETKIFFCEAFIEKQLRNLVFRGEYAKLPHREGSYNPFTKIPNTTCDTVLIIDELQIITPTDKNEKESTGYIVNQYISEVGKYGGVLIAATQRPSNFTESMVANAGTKICFRIEAVDQPRMKFLFGVKDASLFDQVNRFGVAMINNKFGNFESVVLPWADLSGLK